VKRIVLDVMRNGIAVKWMFLRQLRVADLIVAKNCQEKLKDVSNNIHVVKNQLKMERSVRMNGHVVMFWNHLLVAN